MLELRTQGKHQNSLVRHCVPEELELGKVWRRAARKVEAGSYIPMRNSQVGYSFLAVKDDCGRTQEQLRNSWISEGCG